MVGFNKCQTSDTWHHIIAAFFRSITSPSLDLHNRISTYTVLSFCVDSKCFALSKDHMQVSPSADIYEHRLKTRGLRWPHIPQLCTYISLTNINQDIN